MILTGATLILIALMAANHAIHGFGCWGLQPGGPESAVIYDLQILLAMIAFVWLMVSLGRGIVRAKPIRLTFVCFAILASIAMYLRFGWTAHTSIHYLGIENLFAFLTVAATTLFMSTYGWFDYPLELDDEVDEAEWDEVEPQTNLEIPPHQTDNPYRPPQA